ncbi:hypothetical protein SEPCBS119000_005074 [Sporothrix epigloea]|uniref:Vesicle-mediated transport protein n=1 Tax=Sporothrix epigloea TaxID=1892477 RepID=A0ABP0DVK9_9PEZI
MPIPSSHEATSSPNVSSSCPDDQAPRVQSSRLDIHNQSRGSLHPQDLTTSEGSGGGVISSSTAGQPQTHVAGGEAPSASAQSTPIMSPAPLDTDRSQAPEIESVYSHNVEGQDNVPETADKQPEADEDMPISHIQNTTTGSRDVRSTSNERLNLDHNTTVPDSNPTTRSRAGDREVNRHSIPETEIWEPYGTNEALRRLAENRRSAAANVRMGAVSPASMELDRSEAQMLDEEEAWYEEGSMSYLSCDPTSLRLIPTAPSPFLRPGSRFVGTQQSERQVYDVQVEIKHVDSRESFLCGYLRIQGLTEDHPTLTTYFEGEIIGSKYGFNTKHKSWGANDRIDMSHWAKFAAFRPYAKQAKKGNFAVKDYLQKENIFMRWKEHFLVPDHRVRTIHGASFEGFYYICFNQVEGVVHGIYFHSKSEKFQQLELKHVEDRGCMSAVEFR